MTKRVWAWLWAPTDAASMAAFRMLFGLMLATGLTRFLLSGWVQSQFVAPRFFFKFYGFSWVKTLSAEGMTAVIWCLIFLALCIAAGFHQRKAAALFALGFSYLQLIDVTNYLNHYYFVVLMSLLLAVLPFSGTFSVDVWRQALPQRATLPSWMLYLMQLQVAVLYVHAGLAKFQPDWLLHAQPLGIWLGARTETPLLGWLFALPGMAFVFSWAGFLFDTAIVAFLLHPRTRAFAYFTVLMFHALTSVLFNIGMFPVIMVVAATVMFAPNWPKRVMPRIFSGISDLSVSPAPSFSGRHQLGAVVLAAYAAFQVLFPLRHLIYPGDVLWNEEGMRFSWKVMVREKNGSVTFHVRSVKDGRQFEVNPSQYLLPRQVSEMSAQPDLILQMAHHIARDFEAKGHGPVEVRAEAWVSLNGRPPALMIDPQVDLAREADGLAHKRWILPAPATKPVSAFLWAGKP